MQRGTDGLDRSPAQWAGGVPEQPAVDARQVERVAEKEGAIPGRGRGRRLARRREAGGGQITQS